METIKIPNGRRNFLVNTFKCACLCALAPACEKAGSEEITDSPIKDKFLINSGMSNQEVYEFAFRDWYIPVMINLCSITGSKIFLEQLKIAVEKFYYPNPNPGSFYDWKVYVKNSIIEYNKHFLSYEIITDTDEVLEINFTECLFAKIFREAGASSIGYSGICWQDYPMTKAHNKNLVLERDKTLMEGQDCCHFKWYMKE